MEIYLRINGLNVGRVDGWHQSETRAHWIFEMHDGYEIKIGKHHMNKFGIYDDYKIHALDVVTLPM